MPLMQAITELQTKANGPQPIQLPPDDGLQQAGRSFAADFDEVGRKIGALADHAATVEGEKEGRIAGLDPEFRPTHNLGLRSEAFDKAGLQIAGAQMRTRINADFEGAYAQHSADPAALSQALATKADGWRKQTLPELRPDLELAIETHTFQYMREATRAHDDELRQNQAVALRAEMHDGLVRLSQLAYGAGSDEQAAEVLGKNVAALQARLSATDGRGKPLLPPQAQNVYMKDLRREVVKAKALGGFDRVDGVAGKMAYIDKLEADWKDGKGVGTEFDLDEMRNLRSTLYGELRSSQARDKQGHIAIENAVGEIGKRAEEGYAPRPDQLAAIKAHIAQAGSPEQAEALRIAEGTLAFQQGARSATPKQLQDYIDSEKARVGADGYVLGGQDLPRIKMAEKLLSSMSTGLKTDPIEWSARAGRSEATKLDFSSADALTKSLPARIAQADEVGHYYDQAPVYLRPQEKRQVIALAAAGGGALTDVVKAITAGGGEKSKAIIGELWKEAPTLANLGALAQAVPNAPVINDVADGVGLSRNKDYKSLAPAKDKTRLWARDAHLGALSGNPDNEAALIDATNYAYNVRLQRSGKTEDPDLWKRTFREVLGENQVKGETYGGVVRHNGSAVVVPPDVKRDSFDELIGAIKPEDFGVDAPLNAKGPASLAQIRHARLAPVGNGRFTMNVGDTDFPLMLKDANGRDFTLDLNAMKDKLKARRPDLYVDGGPYRPPGMMKLGGPQPVEMPKDGPPSGGATDEQRQKAAEDYLRRTGVTEGSDEWYETLDRMLGGAPAPPSKKER